jgi:hypothetical protein
MAYLRMDQSRFCEAIEFADKNITLCRAEWTNHEVGVGYTVLGAIYLQMVLSEDLVPKGEPIHSLSCALELIDSRKSVSAYEATFCNLSLALLEGYPLEPQHALGCIRKAQKLQANSRITRKTLPGSQLRWILGLVHLRSGATHRAEVTLRRVSRVLKDLGYLGHYSRVSLDLAEVYHRQGQWGRLRILAEEILTLEGVCSKDGLAALRVWCKAIRKGEVDTNTWERVLRTVRWPPQAPVGRLRKARSPSRRKSPQDLALW